MQNDSGRVMRGSRSGVGLAVLPDTCLEPWTDHIKAYMPADDMPADEVEA